MVSGGARDKPEDRYRGPAYSFFFGRSSSGKVVNERTAMQATAVYSCVRILAEAVASLPVHLYRYAGKGKEIERLERQAAIDAELNRPTSEPIVNKPNNDPEGDGKKGRASDKYRRTFWNAMRRKSFYDVENALQVGTDSEGGYQEGSVLMVEWNGGSGSRDGGGLRKGYPLGEWKDRTIGIGYQDFEAIRERNIFMWTKQNLFRSGGNRRIK